MTIPANSVPAADGRPNENTYWVVPGQLLAGEYPGSIDADAARDKLQRYLDLGITCFVDLTEEGEMVPYAQWLPAAGPALPATHERHAISDMSVPEPAVMSTILDAIDASISRGHRVYTHCWGGVGRTGTVVGCYLVRHGRDGRSALRQLEAWWRTVGGAKRLRHPRTPETDAQVALILRWSELDPRT